MEPHNFLFPLGNGTGLTLLDVLLLSLCPIATMLGTMVSSSVSKMTTKPEFVPATELPINLLVKLREAQGTADGEIQKQKMLDEHNSNMEGWYRNRLRMEYLYDSLRLPFVGLVLGLVIALYFVGAITENVTSLARILGLCVLLGYQAPHLWLTQERAIKKLVDKKIEVMLGK
jgi:hypothetical protein